MDDSPLALAAFALGAAGNLVKGLPQFVRTAIRGQVAGLAPGAVWLAAGAAYGLVTRAVTLLLLRRQIRRSALASPLQVSGRSAAAVRRPRSGRGR